MCRIAPVGLHFYRRIQLCPGLSVNVSRSGPSLSLGVRGAHVTVGGTGVTKTIGIPGTGVFYTSRQGTHTGYHSAKRDAPVTPDRQAVADRTAERTIGLLLLIVIVVIFALLRS
jgi:hypothetical protein